MTDTIQTPAATDADDASEAAQAEEFLYGGHLKQLAAVPDLERGWATHVVLSGHLHLRAVEQREGTLQVACAALVEAPYEASVVRIERHGDAIDVDYECVSLHEVTEERVPVFDPPRGEWRGFSGLNSVGMDGTAAG